MNELQLYVLKFVDYFTGILTIFKSFYCRIKMLFEEDTMNFKDFQNVSNLDPGIERIIKESFKITIVI